jgi:hypothetical protein
LRIDPVNSELAVTNKVSIELVDSLLGVLAALERYPPEADRVVEAHAGEVGPDERPEPPEEPTQVAFAGDGAQRHIGDAYKAPQQVVAPGAGARAGGGG